MNTPFTGIKPIQPRNIDMSPASQDVQSNSQNLRELVKGIYGIDFRNIQDPDELIVKIDSFLSGAESVINFLQPNGLQEELVRLMLQNAWAFQLTLEELQIHAQSFFEFRNALKRALEWQQKQGLLP